MALQSFLSKEQKERFMQLSILAESQQKMTRDEKYEYLTLFELFMKGAGILNYQPTPKADLFHRSTAPYRLLHGSNRCVAGETELYDPIDKKFKRIDSILEPFYVVSWTGEKFVAAKANAPFVKGYDSLYRITLSNGRKITATLKHMLLTPSGFVEVGLLHQGSDVCVLENQESEYQKISDTGVLSYDQSQNKFRSPQQSIHNHDKAFSDQTLKYSFFSHHADFGLPFEPRLAFDSNRPQSILGGGLLIHALNVRRLMKKFLNYLCHYFSYFHQCGEQLLWRLNTGLIFFPSPSDVQGHNSFSDFGQKDVLDTKLEHNHSCLRYARLSTEDDLAQHCNVSPDDLIPPDSFSKITSIEYVRDDYYYDLSVPYYHNYVDRSSMVSANSGKTTSGSADLVWMALCIHPYKKDLVPDEYWVVSETYKVQEEASQRKVMEFIPEDYIEKINNQRHGIIESITLNVVNDRGKQIGKSKITFKSADSGIRSFAGAEKRGIWFDEEPPYDVYKECIARIGAGKPLDIWLTMTPIFQQRGLNRKVGMSWTYRELYTKRDGIRIATFGMGIEDNTHLTPEQIEEQKKKYHGVEYDIRIKGEFKLIGGNNVFDVDKMEDYSKKTQDPIKIGYLKETGTSYRFEDYERGSLQIWEEPKFGNQYFIGADIGLGVGSDPSAAIVIDKRCKIVAQLHGQIPPDAMGRNLLGLGKYYNTAWVGVEANAFGIATIDAIKKKYGKMYFRYKVDLRSDVRTKQIGWWTDAKTKPLMIKDFGEALREESLEIPSKALLDEMMTYVLGADGSMNAEPGCHDDLVIAAMIALQVRKKHLAIQNYTVQDYVPSNKLTGY